MEIKDQSGTLAQRLWSKAKADGTGCWVWTAFRHPEGYGAIAVGSRTDGTNRSERAHRVAYTLIKGPIPEGLTVDHLCGRPECINPAHLEAVTGRENTLRGNGIGMRNAAKTACPKGHPYTRTDANGYRHCVICQSTRKERSRAAQRARGERVV